MAQTLSNVLLTLLDGGMTQTFSNALLTLLDGGIAQTLSNALFTLTNAGMAQTLSNTLLSLTDGGMAQTLANAPYSPWNITNSVKCFTHLIWRWNGTNCQMPQSPSARRKPHTDGKHILSTLPRSKSIKYCFKSTTVSFINIQHSHCKCLCYNPCIPVIY